LSGRKGRRKSATYTANTNTEETRPRVGFESTIPAFERAKTFHALDSTITVIGSEFLKNPYFWPIKQNKQNYLYPLKLAKCR
jgi:hypothetical protein